jgi:hypothetical protein
MSGPAYIGRELYLRALRRATPAVYEQLIHVADNATVKCIVEILVNVYKGDVPLEKSELDIFKRHRSAIKSIIRNTTHYKEKKVLLKSNGVLVKKAVQVLLRVI